MITQSTLFSHFMSPTGQVIDGMEGVAGSHLKTNPSHGYSLEHDQMWKFVPHDDGTFNIIDQHGGNYMGVSGSMVVLVAPDPSVRWCITGPARACQIVQPSTGLCATDENGQINLVAPQGAQSQRWIVEVVMTPSQQTSYLNWRSEATDVPVSTAPGSNPANCYSVASVLGLIEIDIGVAIAGGANVPITLLGRLEYWHLFYDGTTVAPAPSLPAKQNIGNAYNALTTGDWATVNNRLDPAGYDGQTR